MNVEGAAELVSQIWECNTLKSVFDLTDNFGKSLGFHATLIAACGKMLISPGKMPPYFTNANPKWVELYLKQDLYSKDPVVKMAVRSHSPFTFAEAFSEKSPDIAAFEKAAAAHGLGHGWSVPVHIVNMPPGVVGFGGPEAVELDKLESLCLSIVCFAAYQKAAEFFERDIPHIGLKLTDRERSILTLVARGKTNWEVGAVLSISEYSVRDYLKRLSEKLETSNRTHTVARAMQHGLIVP